MWSQCPWALDGEIDGENGMGRTLVQLHVRERLPFVHGDEPGFAFAPAGEVDDELVRVVVESAEYGL